MTDTRRRVKLYALNAERQWDDRGTGHVSSSYIDRLKGISLLVRAETDGSLLLESKIQPDTAYQKQQDTLIVWSEGDNFDLALSFQEKAGCDEIWEKICQVQGKDPSVDITQDVVEESEDERFEDQSDQAPPIELPIPEIGKLEIIQELFASCFPIPMRREKLALALETSDGYIKKLLTIFQAAEESSNKTALHHLYHIFKSIFLLNKNAIFEMIFVEDLIFDVVGCLEYDPSIKDENRKDHREYLRQSAKYQQVLKIPQDLLHKIHQTYRVQYIHDAVLPPPSAFEENMLSTLSSFIFFNKVEIVTLISDDIQLLTQLFSELKTQGIPECRRKGLILFLKELCSFAQNLQPQSREVFYKTMTQYGILAALELSLPISDPTAKSAAIDILTAVVEFSPAVVRDYCLGQNSGPDDEQLLLNVVIRELNGDRDPGMGGAVQLSGVLRLLIDPENMLAALNKAEKTDFLNLFYKQSMQILIEPLLTNTVGDKPVKDDVQTAQLLWLLLELLSFCVEHHSYHIRSYIVNKDLVRRVLVLMNSPHTFLVLGALRLLRKVLSLKDELYNRYIVKGTLFSPVIEAFKRNNGRYNLLDSAIIELFEFLKGDETKVLLNHVMETYGDLLDQVNYVQTFRFLKLKFEQSQEKCKDRGENVPALLRTNRFRRDPRQLDDEEEMWFNEEEELEDSEAVIPGTRSPPDLINRKMDDELDSIGKLLDKKSGDSPTSRSVTTVSSLPNRSPTSLNSNNITVTTSSTQNLPTSNSTTNDSKISLPSKSMFQEIFANYCTSQGPVTQVGLVDYDGDSDEDEVPNETSEGINLSEDGPTNVKRAKLS